MMPAANLTTLQIVGGSLMLADMILAAILFAFWEKAGRMRLPIGRR